MSLARAEEAETHAVKPATGGLAFLDGAERAGVHAELRARRWLVVNAPTSRPTPGDLRRAIDDAVEGALALRGALPPSVDVEAGVEITVRDQVFRTRALGATGLALAFPPLPGNAARPSLDARDSAVLAAWIGASQRWPVQLLLDDGDRDAELLMPRRLGDLATTRSAPRSAPIELHQVKPEPVVAAPEAAPPVLDIEIEIDVPIEIEPETIVPPSGEILRADAVDAANESDPPTQRIPRPPPPILAIPRRGVLKKRSRVEAPPSDVAPIDARAIEAAAALMPAIEAATAPIEPAIEAPSALIEAVIEAAKLAAPVLTIELGLDPAPIAAPEPSPRPAAAQRVVNAAEWRAHAVELDKARGPKPVSVIDKLFSSRYMPLVGAIARGEVDTAVKSVADTWRMNFEHSYREAFSALRVTGKRPPMVFDAPDIAARIGRLNSARVVKLLLVDAMRFDIGERVAQHLTERLAGRAVCVERMLLWSAIPTTTATQAALIARGPEGLRDVDPAHEPDPEIVRGRAVATVRRERLGSREVMKLDLVEARLRGAGAGYDERLESIAEEVAQVTVRYIESLPPRTLLFLFGDHGFRLPSSPDGRTTGPATQGGVSPEEVLVPGQAWLVGGVH
ncbi:MAG: hypothetical protein ABJE95_25680 [Byssovorax sp.]